jgi:two-component system, cell cycle response regulator PopA
MRISVRSSDARSARALHDMLLDDGVEAAAHLGPSPSRGRLVEDVAILDARPDARDWAMGYVQRLAHTTPPPGAIVAASALSDPPPARCDVFDGWVQLGAPEGILARELAAIRREGEARVELALRVETARSLGAAVDLTPSRTDWRSLYIGEPSPFYLAQERALSEAGGRLEAAFSSFMGFDYLHDDRFDSVTLNAVNDSATALALCGALRRNARLHHLPTAVIVRRYDEATIAGAVDRGATLIAYADEAPEPSIAWLFEKMGRSRRHAQTEASLTAVRRVCSGADGLFSQDFMAAHLSRLVEASHASARPLALVALKVLPAAGARTPSAASWSRSIGEIAGISARLIRGSDTAGLVDGDLIVALMPNACVDEGRRMAERVAGVVECTSFAAAEADGGPVVLERSVVELVPGESSVGLLSRALDPLMLESARA